MDNILNSQNKELIITLTAPYTNIQQVLSFEDVLESEISLYYDLDKFFRFSFNNINYSNWVELTNENLRMISIPIYSDLWLEYKYVLNNIEEGESITFKDISLEILTVQLKVINQVCDTNLTAKTDACCVNTDTVVEECCPTNLFNPYDVANAIKVYEPIVKLVSDIFGMEVHYHKTNPRLNSKDVILGEYSVYNVEAKCDINIVLPDNILPTKELQYNSVDGVAMPDMFEIHIVRSVFEDAFGEGEIPRNNDYLEFPYLKRVFIVNSVIISDENPFNTANFYRVNLVDYSQKINMIDENDISKDLRDKVDSYESVFGEEELQEIERVVKPDEYVTIDKEKDGGDVIRTSIDPHVLIREHSLINPSTYQIISKYYYDLSIPEESNIDAIEYRYDGGLPDDFSLTFLLQPQTALLVTSVNFVISKIEDTTGTYLNTENATGDNGIIIETIEEHGLIDGSIFYIKNSSYYNGLNIVSKKIDNKRFIVNKLFRGFTGGAITKTYEKQIILDNANTLSVILINGNILISIMNKLLIYPYSHVIKKWTYNILNFSNSFKQIALYVYDEDVKLVYNKTNIIEPILLDKNVITIKTGNYYLTNIRLFNSMIEEEQQVSVLSQNVLADSQNALIVDNAEPQVRLKKYKNNR